MKNKLAVFLFIVSTVLFVVLLLLSVDFAINCIDFQIETSGDFLGALILISVYAVAFLSISVLGLGCSIPAAKLASKKVIKNCSYVEIVFFSIAAIFAVFQLLYH